MTKEHSVCRTPIHVSKVIITRQNQDTRSIIYILMMRPDLALREAFDKALALNPESIAARSGVMTAHMLIRAARGDERGLGENLRASVEGLAVLDELLSATTPPGFMDELRRMAVDSSAQYTIQMPRSLMPGRPNDGVEEKDN